MASLKFIMDVNNEDVESRHTNKKDRDSGQSQSANLDQLHEASSTNTPPPHGPHQRHVSSTGQPVQEDININPTLPASAPAPAPASASASQTKRRGPSTRGFKSVASVSSSTSSSLPTTTTTTTARPSAHPRPRRRSTASIDSMDPTSGGYGSRASSTSMGGGHLHPSNSPMQRPMPQNPPSMPTRLTPITGRVSRAKKGVPVHVCDICKPAKTFTRAEHLRRHQLSHQTPGYTCTNPGCERAFHRPDLLVRHQQRHEQEGDSMSKSGSVKGQHQGLPQSTAGSSPVMSTGHGAPSPGSTNDVPQTPNPPATRQSYPHSQMSSPGHGSNPSTPHPMYGMPTSVSIINPAPSSSLGGGMFHPVSEPYRPARTSPRSIYMVTNPLPSLQIPDPPALCHPNNDASPWASASSASDSTTYTPVSDIPGQHHRLWIGPSNHRSPSSDWQPRLVPPYPNTASRDISSPGGGGGMDGGLQAPPPPLFYPPQSHAHHSHSHYTSSPQQTHSYRLGMLDVSMAGFGPGDGGQRSALSNSSAGTFRPIHHHSNSFSSVRSPTPPPNTTSHTTETLVSSAIPSRIDTLASLHRQKDMVEPHHGLILDGIGVLGGMGLGYPGDSEGGRSPIGGDTGNPGTDMMSALNLEMGAGCGMSGVAMAIPLARPVRVAIPGYLDVYWSRVHPRLPIVHRPSFEAGPQDILRCAMAAVATQYLNGREDRIRGNQLHEYAWQEAKRVTQWDLQIMQAILLCENFARFRGRKAVTKPSKLFESLYQRVLYHNPTIFDTAMLSRDQHNNNMSIEDRWQTWLDAEKRRRLLTASFVADGHAAIYQQQRRALDCHMNPPTIPLSGPSTALWEASSAEEWASLLETDPGAGIPVFVAPPEQITAETILRHTTLDRMAILGVEMLRLPRRHLRSATSVSANNSPINEIESHTQHVGSQFDLDQQPQLQLSLQPDSQDPLSLGAEERIASLYRQCPVANTYLALHHTPLHDLLAVGGDSWVFSQKVLPATSFHEHQKRLKLWAEQHHHHRAAGNNNPGTNTSEIVGLSAARATVYAARAIVLFLERANTAGQASGGIGMAPPWSTDMADYWGLYICALICWAFGHRARTSSAASMGDPRQQRHRSNSGGNSPVSAGGHGISPSAATMAADEEVYGWLRMVAASEVRLDEVLRMRGRREAGGVVGLVRRQLESDCIGGRSRLYVDAVGVLRKLEEGVNWKWF